MQNKGQDAGRNWGGGYVTDIPYLPGYYRQQSPQHLYLACLLGGVAGLDAPPDAGLSYVELGCGVGFGAAALAASNPGWRVTGVDFAPAHIAAARGLAGQAGLSNAQFLEADLAGLAESPLLRSVPEADVISLHGVWSWAPVPVREGIVRLLNARLRPGGVLHISYNTLPGWQSALGFQRLLREAGRRAAGRSDRQALSGLEMARSLAEAGAKQLNAPFVHAMLERLTNITPDYLAHEYMNESWAPCFHADVAEALSAAKLDFVASAQLLENFSELMLSDAQRAVLNRADDPLMRELIKDMCLDRSLRHDVFVRGARRLSPAARDAALGEVMLALTTTPSAFSYEADLPAGRASLPPGIYRPVVEALAEGPRSVRDLLNLGHTAARRNPAELVGMLVGSEQALPVTGLPLPLADQARQFNAAAAERVLPSLNLSASLALATSGCGAPFPCGLLEAYVNQRLRMGEAPAAIAAFLAQDKTDEERDRLAAFIVQMMEDRAPVWRSMGLLWRLRTLSN